MSLELTPQELREAAAEVGLSPGELQAALATRDKDPQNALVRGTQVHGYLPAEPVKALTMLRDALERKSGRRGHAQGSGRFDIVDEHAGFTYKVTASSDGHGGAVVGIDLDTAQADGDVTLLKLAGAGLTFACAGLSILLGSWPLASLAAGLGMTAVMLVLRLRLRLRRALQAAHDEAVAALVHTDDALASDPSKGAR